MSYPGVDPGDVQTMNPVGTQDASPGEPQKYRTEPDPTGKFDQVATPVVQASQAAHDSCYEPGNQNPGGISLEAAVQQKILEMFAVTDAWKPRGKVQFKHEFPSGQTSLLQHLDTMDLIEYDLLEELDFFTRRLFPKTIDPSGNPIEHSEENETLVQALRDPEKRKRFLDLTGRMMAAASVEPKVIHDGVVIKESPDSDKRKTVFGHQLSRDEQIEAFGKPIPELVGNQSYSGAVDFADRMSLFHELNKPLKMIEPFRPESSTLLQDLAGSEGHGGQAE